MTMFQLRRIGLPPSIEEIRNSYKISCDTYIGRGKTVDIFLDSNIRKGLISRAHAHILKQTSRNNDEIIYRVYDTSLNGTYINDVRINNSQILKDGDKIAFGHLRGAIIEPGEVACQKETEFLFKFEVYTKEEMTDCNSEMNLTSSVFMSPNSIDKEQILPGVLPIYNLHERNCKDIDKKPLHDRRCNSMMDQSDTELNSIISNVTSKILNEDNNENNDSFNFDISLKTEFKGEPADNFSSPSCHPTRKLLNNIKRCDSPSSLTSGSDHEVKCDTSLSITHVYENVQAQFRSDALRSKVRKVFRDHDTKRTLETSSIRDRVHIPLDSKDDDDEESIFSDKSEEIPDSESDSDFLPDKSVSSDAASRTRTRRVKTPSRFSPQHESKKQKLNTKEPQHQSKNQKANIKEPMQAKKLKIDTRESQQHLEKQKSNTKESLKHSKNHKLKTTTIEKQPNDMQSRKRNRNNSNGTIGKFTHDKCAAWDCVRPAGSIKQITWVACDDCDAWYHVSCSGLSAEHAMEENTNYHCGCA